MLIVVVIAFLGWSQALFCHASVAIPASEYGDLYRDLVARIEVLEQRDRLQEETIVELQSNMAAMADAMALQQEEIKNLKKNAIKCSTMPQPPEDKETRGTAHDEAASAPKGAIRDLPGPQGVRRLSRAAAGEKVAFFATSNQGSVAHLGVNQNIVFEKAVVNIGNAYNSHHGLFVAPVSGTYLFSASILSDHNREVYAHVALNGSPVPRIYARGTDGRHDQGSQTVVLALQQGDDVSVQNDLTDDAIWGQAFSTFSGVLLWQTFSASVIVG